jgi:hypothetical protein
MIMKGGGRVLENSESKSKGRGGEEWRGRERGMERKRKREKGGDYSIHPAGT